MAYEPTIWKDRVVEKPRTFNIVNNPDGTVTLVPAPGVVVEEGTPVNAANLNKLEQGLKTHEADNAKHSEIARDGNGLCLFSNTPIYNSSMSLNVDTQGSNVFINIGPPINVDLSNTMIFRASVTCYTSYENGSVVYFRLVDVASGTITATIKTPSVPANGTKLATGDLYFENGDIFTGFRQLQPQIAPSVGATTQIGIRSITLYPNMKWRSK